MTRLTKSAFSVGCLISVLGTLAALLLYPKAAWLFALAIVGIALAVISRMVAREATPFEVAERAERLLNGLSAGWDVDDYEHLNPHEPRLRELWNRTIEIGGLPEEWLRLSEAQKTELRSIITKMRGLAAP
jgi:hypothetical protein